MRLQTDRPFHFSGENNKYEVLSDSLQNPSLQQLVIPKVNVPRINCLEMTKERYSNILASNSFEANIHTKVKSCLTVQRVEVLFVHK